MRAWQFLFALALTSAAATIGRSFGAPGDVLGGSAANSTLAAAQTTSAAAPAIMNPYSAVEAVMLADAGDGCLSEHSLLRAALIASGSDDPLVWTACERRLQGLAAEHLAQVGREQSVAERAAAMHDLLFRRVLTGTYDSQVNNLAELFRSGRYNCVTASTLLMAFAAECGVETAALEAPAHVLVILDPRGAAVAVEMTARDWRPSPRQSHAVPAAGPGRVISAEQLLATYYHNRGVQRLSERDYAAAVAANRAALALDAECLVARQNLLASLSHWALALADAGDIHAALDKINVALAIAPDYEPLRENRVYIEQQRDARPASRAPGAPRSARLAPRLGPIAPKFF